jgi:hypothetical protein
MMEQSEIAVGAVVEHDTLTAWGPGKVVGRDAPYFWVFFPYDRAPTEHLTVRKAKRFLLAEARRFTLRPDRSDALLANLQPAERRQDDYVLPEAGFSLEAARVKFLNLFPGGFAGEAYFGDAKRGERAYKVAAHERFAAELGGGRLEALLAAGDVAEAARRAKSVVGAVNLLSPYESMALADALQDDAGAGAYLGALARLLAAPELNAASFEDYLAGFRALRQVGEARVHSWVVCTALPFLAQPHRFMHLKPSETKAAQRLGFDLRYDAMPNWTTYGQLLAFAGWLAEQLTDLGCRDMIDVQSFVFATCGGYDPTPEKKAKHGAKAKPPSM